MIQDLYERHFEELRRYCLQLCGSGDMAFDLVQETFVKALEREEAMNGFSPEQQRSWLYKAARNLFLDDMRRISLLQRKQNLLLSEEEMEKPSSSISSSLRRGDGGGWLLPGGNGAAAASAAG